MRISVSTITALCFTALVAISCSNNKKNDSAAGRRGGMPGGMAKDYAVLTLSQKTVTIHKNFPATIEGQQVIEIRPMINGYIQDIHVNEGDHVKKGQLLFRIKNPQYEQEVITAKASVSKANADVNNAKMEIEKVKPLVEKQIVSDYRLKSAQLNLEAMEAELEQAKAALSNAETNVGYTMIKSPMDGIIGTIPYKIGALVSSNSSEALTTLSDIGNILAYFSWNEKQLLDLLSGSKGSTIEEKIKSLPPVSLILSNSTEYSEKGKIELASGLISTTTGSATLKAVFSNKDGIIRSGSSATIRIPQVKDSILIVPQSATYELQNKRFIYLVGADNKVTAVNFSSIPSDDGKYFLVTDGLKPGDKVVIEGITSLRDGNAIIPKETNPDTYYGNLK